METSAIDFTAWGLDEDWPALRWIEPVNGRRGQPVRGVRLGHAGDSAMVLTCTYPRDRFDAEAIECGFDPLREIAFETTYTQVNLALHQIREPAERPDGLIGSLLRHADREANRYRDWATTHWGEQEAAVTPLASWASGFSTANQDAYIVVHACGTALDDVRLAAVGDLTRYELGHDPDQVEGMHWELWRARPDVGYDDLTSVLATR
jgi:hypothetical protein